MTSLVKAVHDRLLDRLRKHTREIRSNQDGSKSPTAQKTCDRLRKEIEDLHRSRDCFDFDAFSGSYQMLNGADPAQRALAMMLSGWLMWTDEHRERMREWADDGSAPPLIGHTVKCSNPIADGWHDIGSGIRDLLTGEVGRLNRAAVDEVITKCFELNGWDIGTEQPLKEVPTNA